MEFKDLKALVVDDYDIMRQHLCNILKQLGIELHEAKNGLEALEFLKNESVNVVFSDIVMPVMDGFELCEELRKSSTLCNIPIIVLSTHCDTTYIVKALRQGADDYIPKPATSEIVQKVLSRVMASVELT